MCRQITAGRGCEPGRIPLGRYNSAGTVLFCAKGLVHGRRIREPIDAKRIVLALQLDAVAESLLVESAGHANDLDRPILCCGRRGRRQASRDAQDDATRLQIQQHA